MKNFPGDVDDRDDEKRQFGRDWILDKIKNNSRLAFENKVQEEGISIQSPKQTLLEISGQRR